MHPVFRNIYIHLCYAIDKKTKFFWGRKYRTKQNWNIVEAEEFVLFGEMAPVEQYKNIEKKC